MGLYTLFDFFASLSVLKSNNYATSFLNIKTKNFIIVDVSIPMIDTSNRVNYRI